MKISLFPLLSVVALVAACSTPGPSTLQDAGTDAAPEVDAAEPGLAPDFERFCQGKDFVATQKPAVAGKLSGMPRGFYQQGPMGGAVPQGMTEMMRIIPKEPMLVDKIRAAFGKGAGRVRFRLEYTLGRSYPASYMENDPTGVLATDYPDYDPMRINVIPPVEFDVPATTAHEWIEFDVSQYHAALEPTQHYMLIYEHLTAEPFLSIESIPAGEQSRALLMEPGSADAYGVSVSSTEPGNYRLELAGRSFCEWTASEKLFNDTTPATMAALTAVGPGEFADINGDAHEDLVIGHTPVGAPQKWSIFFGDGTGNFAAANDGLSAASYASMLVFGDYDNDGDQDAIAYYYVSPDQDGDTVTIVGGDCNDLDAAIKPGATEVANGKDDNCDGTADEGTAGAGASVDSDGDTYTVATGDCDDTQASVHPTATELLDARDNDCSGQADETFKNKMLINSAGSFAAISSPAIEFAEPIGQAGIGDTDNDGNLDVYWGSWLLRYPNAPAGPSHFVRGVGDGTFVDEMATSGIVIPTAKPVYGVTFADYDGNGWPDIFVGNYQLNDNLLWKNDGTGYFSNVAPMVGVHHDEILGTAQYPGGHSYGSEFVDIDNDGDLDFFLCNLSHPRTQPWADTSKMYINQGAPSFNFIDKRVAMGILYDEGDINVSFADFDNDMDLDFVIGGAYPEHYSRLYRNDGARFVDVTYEAGIAIANASGGWADLNEDGAMDLVERDSKTPNVHVFLNRATAGTHWVEFVTEGKAGNGGTSNRDGIGARVKVTTSGVSQIREVRGNSGGGITSGLNSRLVHFGLAQNTAITTVTVTWVGGMTETFTGVAIDGLYRLTEGAGTAVKIR